jgi:adenosine deaminase
MAVLPMAELHIHIEGTLEDDMKQRLAKRNKKILRTRRILDVRGDFQYACLQDFLDLYYEGCEVLIHERDFYEMTEAYFYKVSLRNVRHVELFFDPQSHSTRSCVRDCG